MIKDISEREKYLFDVQGFLVVKDILTPAEVDGLNKALDENWDKRADGALPEYTSDAIEGDRIPQGVFAGMFTWEHPWCDPFRELIAHPPVFPYLSAFLGRGWHMDMDPVVFHSTKGTRGTPLHGGYPHFQGGEYYHCANGQIRNGLMVFEFLLTDQNEGDGGFCCIPGSHKSNFLRPKEISMLTSDASAVVNPSAKAGDLIIFTEALGHGTLPWTGSNDRRVILVRFSSKFVGFGNGFHSYRFPEWVGELTEAQQAVLEPAYFYHRPLIGEDGTIERPPTDPDEPPGRYNRVSGASQA